jgi:hypothetical protein
MTSALPFPHPGLLIHFLVCGMVGNVITYVLGPKEAEAYAAIPDVPQGITPEQCAKEYVDLIERSGLRASPNRTLGSEHQGCS